MEESFLNPRANSSLEKKETLSGKDEECVINRKRLTRASLVTTMTSSRHRSPVSRRTKAKFEYWLSSN